MPTYDYYCDSNDQTVEAKHKMSEKLTTWGQLCEHTGGSMGDTPADAPVKRLATGGQVIKRSSLGEANVPGCDAGSCCGGGACGLM